MTENPNYDPGSPADFDRLYEATYRKVLGTIRVIVGGDMALAEDCAQDTYLRAYAAWPRWRPTAPAEAWIQRIAVNTAISARRKRKLLEVGEIIRRLGRPQEGIDPTEAGGSQLLAALGKLKPTDAAVIVLRHHHGYTNRDIAKALRIPESTVSTRLVTARRRLRALLEEAGEKLPPVNSARTSVVAVNESVGGHAR